MIVHIKETTKGKRGNLYITEIVFSSAFQKSTFERHRMKLKKNLATRRQHFDFPSSVGQNVSPPTFANG